MTTRETRKRYLQYLGAVPEFRACTTKQIEQVDRLADRLVCLPGDVLTAEGRVGRELYVILTGTAEVTRGGRVVNRLGPGDYFGELAAIDTEPRNATVTATSSLDVLIIGPREFTTMLEDIPGFRETLLKGMARRIRAADQALVSAQSDQAPLPLAHILELFPAGATSSV
jgi:CRP/FNR family cyclic AMP-dependent transcriptional regulator